MPVFGTTRTANAGSNHEFFYGFSPTRRLNDDKDGDQPSCIDEVDVTIYQAQQVVKLQVQQGKTDYCHDPFNRIDLSDIAALSQAQDKGHYRMELWGSGPCTASMFFLNYVTTTGKRNTATSSGQAVPAGHLALFRSQGRLQDPLFPDR